MYLFDKCADNYDQFRKGSAPYLFSIISLLKKHNTTFLLDIGCGTGNLFYQISQHWQGKYVGLDISEKMLRKAQEKKFSAHWVCADVQNVPVYKGSFDAISGIYILHLLDSIPDVLKECRRVLNRGWIAFVSAPHHFIKNHPLNEYFPSFSEIDAQRFPKEQDIIEMLLKEDFYNVRCEYYISIRDWLSEEYLIKIESKFISTLRLIPQNEFEEGLANMKEELSKGTTKKLIPWESVLIMGFCN